jgi:hypothetical protein
VFKYACPDDADYREPEIGALLQSCQLASGIRFSLTQEGGLQGSEQETRQDGYVAWDHERGQTGEEYETTVEEMTPADYPYRRIYCTTAMPGQYPVVTYAAETEETSFTYDHPDGAQVACAWFNIPEYLEQTGQGGPDGEGDEGALLIRKIVCDDLYPTDIDWSNWFTTCSVNPAVAGYEYRR